MKIIWNQNPLRSVVELDDRDKEYMRATQRNEELLDALCYIGKTDEDRLAHHKEITSDKFLAELDEEVERVLGYLFSALEEGEWHAGDCVCFPCSCTKCVAENVLGISTIPGIGTQFHYIQQAYAAIHRDTGHDASIDEAIMWMKNKKMDATSPYFNRMTEQNASALSWLKHYKELHF